MADRPIIFSGPMVQALLAGRKSQTRRVLNPQPFPVGGPFYRPFEKTDPCLWYSISAAGTVANIQKVPYTTGDRLYVREAFSYDSLDEDRDGKRPIWFWADGNPDWGNWTRPKPSIHMPRWASRLTLTVTEVRVQRLQEISETDAWAEGCKAGTIDDNGDPFPAEEPHHKGGWVGWDNARDWYADLWESLHGPDAWDENPWVVAITFTTERRNIDAI